MSNTDNTITNNKGEGRRTLVVRASILSAAVTASALAGVTVGPSSGSADEPPERMRADNVSAESLTDASPYVDQSGIAEYARANDLTGLSPASLSPYVDQSGIAEYARANDLTGLSPASMHPIPTTP